LVNQIKWLRSDITYRTAIFEALIIAEEPLRIGKGREELPLGASDLPVIRIKEVSRGIETPYIPGSSLKGVYRSASEQISKQYNVKPEPCSGLANNNCMAKNKQVYNKILEYIKKDGNEDTALQMFEEVACIICKLFGTQSYKSKIHFNDAYPFTDAEITVSTGTKIGIAIDRTTGAAARGALYNVEYVSPGSKFNLRIIMYNLPNYALGLITQVTNMIDEGYIKLGGFKSRGFGKVRIDSQRMTIIHNSPYSGNDKTLKPLDGKDSEIIVSPTATDDNRLFFQKERLIELSNKLWEAWKNYAASKG